MVKLALRLTIMTYTNLHKSCHWHKPALFRNRRGLLLSKFFLLLIFFGTSCSEPETELVKVKTEVNNVDVSLFDSLKGDSAVKELIAPYKARLEAEMNEVLAVSAMPMEKSQPEGLLGNFVADLIYNKCKARYKPTDGIQPDFCLINNGGLRVPLPEGKVTKGKIFELMPFENELVVVTISGEKAKELFEYIAIVGGQPVSNIKMGIQDGKPVNVMIGGKAFDVNRNYKVVTSDYLANGGDKMEFFLEPINRENVAYKIRDAIIDHVREMGSEDERLKAELDQRIYEHRP